MTYRGGGFISRLGSDRRAATSDIHIHARTDQEPKHSPEPIPRRSEHEPYRLKTGIKRRRYNEVRNGFNASYSLNDHRESFLTSVTHAGNSPGHSPSPMPACPPITCTSQSPAHANGHGRGFYAYDFWSPLRANMARRSPRIFSSRLLVCSSA